MPHSRNNGFYHFVWATWDRELLLAADKESHMHDLIRFQCAQMKVSILALNGMADHIHLLVTMPTTLCIADFMEKVKGTSARALNDAYASPAYAFKWQGGYNYDTVSVSHVQRVQRYIERQKQRHADGILWPSSEPPENNPPSPMTLIRARECGQSSQFSPGVQPWVIWLSLSS